MKRICLIEPTPPEGFVSGGYRYNDAIGHRLQLAGYGEKLSVAPADLNAVLRSIGDDAITVLDGLFCEFIDPVQALAGVDPAGLRLLVHCVPSDDPDLDDESRRERAANEARWFDAVGAIITTSMRVTAALRTANPRRVALTAEPGVERVFRIQAPDREPSARLTVITVGNLIPQKGQLAIVDALRGSDARLVLVGATDADAEYTHAVEQSASGIDLEFAGVREATEIADMVREADLFVSASRFESYGMAIAEAAATGIPILAFGVGGVGQWVRHGVDGLLLDPNDPDSLQRELAALAADRGRLASMRGVRDVRSVRTWEEAVITFVAACGGEQEPEQFARCKLPTRFGDFDLEVYQRPGEPESLLISRGELDREGSVFVRIHSECFTGEVLGSLKCDCNEQLETAMQEIVNRGVGAIVYLRQEGRGIGLGNKIRAYAEQDHGADTIEANHRLGFPTDAREFSIAAQILRRKGARTVELNTNNPMKIACLQAYGFEVEVAPSVHAANPHNVDYLRTKLRDLGHTGLVQALPDREPSD